MGSKSTVFGLLATAFLFGGTGCGDGEDRTGSPAGETPAEAQVSAALPEGAQALSLLGEPLYPAQAPEEVQTHREQQLEEALADLEADPEGAEALIWVGRRYAYLGEYRQALQVFSLAMEFHPQDPRFLRHRGHRYISVREFDNAIADYRRAAELIQGSEDEVEPDGQPNAMGIPTSTLHFNIWYHYGLAHYLKGEFDEAASIYERCMAASAHPDSKIATAHWWYMALMRGGRGDEARELIEGLDLDALEEGMIESGSYMEMLRLYARASQPEDTPTTLDPQTLEGATLGYGLGNFAFYNGDASRARDIYEHILAARDQWASFGYIAAEADMARLGG